MRWSTADSSVGAKASPEREAGDRPDERGDRPDEGAVGEQHEAEVLLRGADGGEHAELAEPSLRDDREACGGDQRGQEQEDGGHGEHRQRVRRRCVVPRRLLRAREGRAASVTWRLGRRTRSTRRSRRRRTVTWSGAPCRRGGDERELVAQLARVLDDADDRPAPAVERQGRADLEPQELATPSVTATCRGPVG